MSWAPVPLCTALSSDKAAAQFRALATNDGPPHTKTLVSLPVASTESRMNASISGLADK